MFILDFGSGNTCKNDWLYAKRMIDEFLQVYRDAKSKKEIVLKWQLFIWAGDNTPLNRKVFEMAFFYAWGNNFQTTASVFDESSLDFLLSFDIPFVKIANHEMSKRVIDLVPDEYKIIRSVDKPNGAVSNSMCCISKYPATIEDYEKIFSKSDLKKGISDHTTDWTLYTKYKPNLFECHYCLNDSEGLDAGPFARRPAQLKEIL